MQAENRIIFSIGNYFNVEFESLKRKGQDDNHFVFFRVEGNGELLSTQGAMYINLETKAFSFMYDILSVNGTITDVKHNGNSVFYAITVGSMSGEIKITFYD